MRLKFLTAILFIILFAKNGFAQDKSNRGKEFWLAYGFDYSFFNESPINFQELAIYISTEQQAANVTVTVTNTSFSQTLTIPANTVDASILIPKTGVNDARTLTDGLQNRNIHIVSDVPVAVYAHVYSTMVSGATMLMPVETYGYIYHSINYSQNTSASPLPTILPTVANGADWYSWFYVIASEDNTKVEITPSNTTKNGWLPNQTYTVTLNKGESYHVFGKLINGNSQAWAASKDMTGSKVVSVTGGDGSCHPVAVFSGSGGIRLCRGDGGEFVHQQVFPAQAWGTRYLTYHTINNISTNILETNRNIYRICVADPTTVVKKNGVVMTGLQKNFYYEYMDSTGGDYIETDKPTLVAQYTPNKNQCWNFPTTTPSPPSYGNPEMFYLSPIEQGQKSVLFYSSRKSSIDYVYTNILVPTTGVSSLKVDRASLPASQIIPHPHNASYSVALARLTRPAAQHTITSDSAFTATVYGLGNYESYGYNVGTLVNNLNYYSSIQNTNNISGNIDTVTCPKTPLKLFIKLGYPASYIHWMFSQVAGISPNVDSIITSPSLIRTENINGRIYYVYGLQQDFTFASTGTYNIPITYGATVIQNCSQSENATIRIVVKSGPVADFNYTGTSCLKDTLAFTGTYTASGFNITKFLWNFDDNTFAITQNTTKKFNTAGSQNVRFRVYADNGCIADTTRTLNINPTPIAKLGVDANSCAKDSVYISDTSSVATGTITNWYYNFGDGNTLNKNTSSGFYHPYILAGNYTIKLVATSNSNCISDTAYKSITVNPKPVAKFGYNKNICIGDSIKFSDSSTIISGSITSWKWIFGDGNSQTNTTSSPFYHTYSATGNYDVKLVTVSDKGCVSDTFKLTVTVVNKPTSTFTTAGMACIDSLYTFTSSVALGTGNPPVWYWNFDDGQTFSTSTTHIATHAYTNSATNLLVKHVVSYGAGCTSDTTSKTIPIISKNPVATFSYVGDTLCENKPIVFNATANPNIINWNWLFGPVPKTDAPPITYSFGTANTYNVSLTIKESSGCISAPFTKTLTINPTPSIDAGLSKVILKGASTTLDATINNAANYNFLWTPSLGLSANNILNPIATPLVTTLYTVTAIDKVNYCYNSDSTKITVVNKLNIPNVFSPNGDGVNDKWIIEGIEFYPAAIVSIFDRNGQIVYERKNYKASPWDGTINGKTVPVGVYPYIIQLSKEKGDYIAGVLTILK